MQLIRKRTFYIAQIEGKKYYLLNINELQNGTNAISRILRYGTKEEAGAGDEDDLGIPPTEETPPTETPEETPPAEETPEV